MASVAGVKPPTVPGEDKASLSNADSMASGSAPMSPMSGISADSPAHGAGSSTRGSVAGQNNVLSEGSAKPRGQLVQLAEKEDRARAVIKGYLKKENSQGKWQKRWFEVVSHYFVYYKRNDSGTMLCAMDLWKAHNPEVPTNEFSIRWDRFRLFRADTPEESVRWVNVLRATQAANPALAKLQGSAAATPEDAPSTEKAGGCCVVM